MYPLLGKPVCTCCMLCSHNCYLSPLCFQPSSSLAQPLGGEEVMLYPT